MNPATVQSDIDRRRTARKTQLEEARIAGERDRMAEWLATYHRNAQAFHEEEKSMKKIMMKKNMTKSMMNMMKRISSKIVHT